MVIIQCGTVKFHNIQAVIWDKDGTLADSQAYLRTLAQKRARLIDAQIPGVQDPLAMAFGLEVDRLNPAGLMAVGTRYENEIAAAAYVAETGRGWLESRSIARSAFSEADQVFKRKADHTPLFAGISEMLHNLSVAGLRLGILSADTSENVRDFVDRYELGSLIDYFTGIDQGVSKPDPSLVYQVCDKLEVSPENTLMIGDALVDIEMAKAAGTAGCIGVTWGGAQASALQVAEAIATHPAEIQVLADCA